MAILGSGAGKSRRKKSNKPAFFGEKPDKQVLRRTAVLMLVFGIVLFIPLIIWIFNMMVLQHDKYESEAISNQTRVTAVSADRGTIYDRNMNILAASATVENVFIDPLEIDRADEDVSFIAENLARILDIDEAMIIKRASNTERQYEVIARKQPAEVTDKVRQFINDNELTGIHMEPSSQRYYPYGTLAAQVIGFTNDSNEGAEGLEAYYNATLEGTSGAVITTKGNYETEMLYNYEKFYEASDGNSLVLAVDSTVQFYLEKNLQAAIEKYDVQNGGFAVLMDVNTGALLGMAIEGSYDPNDYLEIYDTNTKEELDLLLQEAEALPEDSKEREEASAAYNAAVVTARLSQWRNRTVSDGYEPGSTFKLITLAAALEEKAVTLDDSFYCGGAEKISGREQVLHCWRPQGHHAENTAQALQNSCNIAFAHIGLRLGGEKLYDYADAFGLLEKTGIDMSGEGTGYFHDKEHLADAASYGTSYLTSTAFGQSFKVTPIQLVRAVAAIVNGGYVLKPYVVEQVLDKDGNITQQNGRTVLRQAISEETSKIMCELMESVVTDGTAGNASLTGYRIGGKTGTSEKLDTYDENGNRVDDKIVSFVGVAPIDDPQYVLLVALDTPSPASGYYISGGIMAAPTVRDIFADVLPYLDVTPDYTGVDMSTVNVEMLSVIGKTEDAAAELLEEQSLNYIVRGTGSKVTGQIPAAGTMLPGKSEVILYMGEAVPTDKITVPDLSGRTSAEARQILANSGLYLQSKGSSNSWATVTSQNVEPGKEVDRGTTITVEYTDHSAQD